MERIPIGAHRMHTGEIEIADFTSSDADAFRTLNEEWIRAHFALEAEDLLVLNDPESYIVRPGGYICIARAGDEPVGCCALIAKGAGVYELAKMAVAPQFRGRGIGRKLLQHAVDRARRMGAKALFLGSNTKLAEAIHLYESYGFLHLPASEAPELPYARANVFMSLTLEPTDDPIVS
jgi:putative acetyltransferase